MNKFTIALAGAFLAFSAAVQAAAGKSKDTGTATAKIYLSGTDADHTATWQFYCSDGMNSRKWRKIQVPSCWEQQGFGAYTYGRYYKTPGLKPSTETGTYRHTFSVPEEWRGRKVEIVFEGVMTDTRVTVNGRQAGDVHQGGFTQFAYDISRLLEYGRKNKLEVSVSKQSADASVNAAERRADWWLFGGIYRPVYLRALPEVHIERADIYARADGTMAIRLTTGGLTAGYRLEAGIDGLGTNVMKLEAKRQQTVEARWTGAETWNPEQPNLYLVHLKLIAPDGTVAHRITRRTGFRTIEFRERDGFYLNGTKLLVKGVNRHCFYPETGRTASRAKDIADVKMIKAMNANAIRSHYPPNQDLLDICDSLGVLYFDELPGWQNSYRTSTGRKILAEMMATDANHPCIFAWGNGNEGGNNLNLDPLFAELDLQRRHVVHPWAQWGGVDAHHYPAYQTGVARLHNGSQVFMPTEFLHAQYDKGAGASLDEYWARWTASPLFAGGFIWAWADEGVMRTDRGMKIDTDGGHAPDGIVGPHREKEGSWFTVRHVWSPIQISPLTVSSRWNGRLYIENQYLFSSLGKCSMHYSVTQVPAPATGREPAEIAAGQVSLPDIGPGCRAAATVSLPANFAEGDIFSLTALDPRGDTINVWTWPMRHADEYFALRTPHGTTASARAVAARTADSITLSANGVKAVFSTATGSLLRVERGGKATGFGGGPLPVGMKMELQRIDLRHDGGCAVAAMHYTGAADSIVWRMTPDGRLGMDAVVLNTRNGKKFGGEFFDQKVSNIGFSFSYPEQHCAGMRWMGRGPYRVWRNRQHGTCMGVWQKDYNNTVTGQSETRLVYPEFKGYHANLYWAEMQSAVSPMRVYCQTDGIYYRVFTPQEPKVRAESTMQPFPEGDISFLFDIPAMRSYKPIEQLGPNAQPANIRINKGDDGLRMQLWFEFM